jgi:hypothetical protein
MLSEHALEMKKGAGMIPHPLRWSLTLYFYCINFDHPVPTAFGTLFCSSIHRLAGEIVEMWA